MADAKRDENRVPTLLAETNNAARTPTPLKVDPVTGRVLVDIDTSSIPAGPGYAATSTTALAIETGSKTFVTQEDLAYSVGARVRASSAADTTKFMEGKVTSYSGANLVINVDYIGGSGSPDDWNINLAGDPFFVYIAYASADDGTDFTTTYDADLAYMAILVTNTYIATPLVTDFAGLWKKYGGEYVYIAYASADDGTDFTTTFDADLDYIAVLKSATPIAAPAASDFAGLWKNYKGAKGDQGDKGDKGDTGIGGAIVEVPYIIDGGGLPITTGQKGFLKIPFACTINQVDVYADQSGSIVVDIWKEEYADFPPADADSITASAPPTLDGAQASQDSTLTGWTKTIAAGDVLAYNVDSCTTCTRVVVTLKVTRT